MTEVVLGSGKSANDLDLVKGALGLVLVEDSDNAIPSVLEPGEEVTLGGLLRGDRGGDGRVGRNKVEEDRCGTSGKTRQEVST